MVEKTPGSGAARAPDSDYSLVFDATSDYMVLIKVEPFGVLRVLLTNRAYVANLQKLDPTVSRESLQGVTTEDFGSAVSIPAADYTAVIEQYRKAIRTKRPVVLEEVVELKGRRFYLQSTYTPILDESGACTHVLFVGRDITSQKEVEAELRALLQEREVLIKELFHRTKNNMSVISSLFSVYAADATTEEIPIIVSDIAEKIQAMSAVHARLYQSSDLDHLVLSEVVQDVVAVVLDEFAPHRSGIQITITADIRISIEVALPLSMVLQQILATTMRLPVDGDPTGNVEVTVSRDPSTVRVEISCVTGALEHETDLRERTGMCMIREIVTRQLYGELTEPDMSASKVARWVLRLPLSV
jgi:PAS domain S-box-containing protein